MGFFSAFLLAFSASLDSLAVGIVYGCNKITIKFKNLMTISLITAIGTFLSMMTGYLLSNTINKNVANYIGAFLLIGLGLWFFISSLKKDNKKNYNIKHSNNNMHVYKDILDNPKLADSDSSHSIDSKECISLAIALSLNNLGIGISSSISGINPFISTFLTFFIGMFLFVLGIHFGEKYFSNIFGQYCNLITSILIIILGFIQLFF